MGIEEHYLKLICLYFFSSCEENFAFFSIHFTLLQNWQWCFCDTHDCSVSDLFLYRKVEIDFHRFGGAFLTVMAEIYVFLVLDEIELDFCIKSRFAFGIGWGILLILIEIESMLFGLDVVVNLCELDTSLFQIVWQDRHVCTDLDLISWKGCLK